MTTVLFHQEANEHCSTGTSVVRCALQPTRKKRLSTKHERLKKLFISVGTLPDRAYSSNKKLMVGLVARRATCVSLAVFWLGSVTTT